MEAETPLLEHMAAPFSFGRPDSGEKIPVLDEEAVLPMRMRPCSFYRNS